MSTDWITVDVWSQLVKFDVDTHVKDDLVLGLFVLNRCPDPAEDELVYYPETVYTTHGIKRLLDTGRIKYHYIEYVIVAPRTIKHDYFQKPLNALRDRYCEEPAKYKSMQNQFVGSTFRMYDNKHQAAILFNHDFAQALRTEWEKEPDTKVTLNTVSSVHGIWW